MQQQIRTQTPKKNKPEASLIISWLIILGVYLLLRLVFVIFGFHLAPVVLGGCLAVLPYIAGAFYLFNTPAAHRVGGCVLGILLPSIVEKLVLYAGADCVMDINSTTEEVDLQIFSLARRNNKQKITQKQSETMIDKGKLVMDHKKHKVFWNDVALHLTRQEYNFLYLLAATPMRVYTFEQIYQLVWKDYPVGDIKNIIWCLVKRLRKKLNVVEDGAGNCIVSVRDIGYKFELNKENEQK